MDVPVPRNSLWLERVKYSMDDNTIKALAAMGCITVLEAIALSLGIDGVLLATAVGALAGIAGYEIKAWRNKQ